MPALWQFFRSPRVALGALLFLALYAGAAAWYPWQTAGAPPAPRWAAALHLDHPFSSPVFLAAVALLFFSTAVCTWDRTVRVATLFRGRVRPFGFQLPARSGVDAVDFLLAHGFTPPGQGGRCFRARLALWGGWLLHLGLLSLVAGVFVQRGWHESGAFEVAEGETVRLDAPRVVFGRERGPFAAADPPAVEVGLLAFDPFLHQRGYAPDRASRLQLARDGQRPRTATLDRAAGVAVGSVTIFHAIPSGLALIVELPGQPARALHLREEGPHRHAASFSSPAGQPVRFTVESERPSHDAAGTGALAFAVESPAGRTALAPGTPFDFGGTPARLAAVTRWGGFTYAIDPGMPAVFAGFALVLAGATLMTFPAGAAEIAGGPGEPAAWVFLTRGREALLADWHAADRAHEATPDREDA